MCHLQNIAMGDYQESVTTGQTDRQTDERTDAGTSDLFVQLCFAGNTKMNYIKVTDTGLETYFFSNSQTFASGFNLNLQIAVSYSQLVLL